MRSAYLSEFVGAVRPEMEERSRKLVSIATPIAGSLLFTGAIISLMCKPPLQGELSWLRLVALAFEYTLVAMGVYVVDVWILCRLFGEHIESSFGELVSGSWICAALLPLFFLLIRQDSIWMVSVPPVIVACVAIFLRSLQGTGREECGLRTSDGMGMFSIEEEPALLRMILPAAVTAIAFELGVGAWLLGLDVRAGWLFAASIVLPVWRFPLKLQVDEAGRTKRSRLWFFTRDFLVGMVLAGIALMPFLKYRSFSDGMLGFLHSSRNVPTNTPKPPPAIRSSSLGYDGVILYPPPKKLKEIIAPAPVNEAHLDGRKSKPVIIPFDGVYWYFKPWDKRPQPDSHVIHGDPTKANVRSADRLPVSMEAHQYLASSVELNCCRSLRVELTNADTRPGLLRLEVLLKNRAIKGAPIISLGSLPLPSSENSSIAADRSPVDEALTFPIPVDARKKQFDEIVIVVEPAQERALVGARIAIQQFALLP